MSSNTPFERMIVTVMADEASGGDPEQAIEEILSTTRRMRPWPLWLALFKEPPMRISATRIALAAAAVVLVAAVGITFLPRPGGIAGPISTASPSPAPSPTASPAVLLERVLTAGTYVTTPFFQPGSDACFAPPQAGCIDSTNDDALRFTATVPDGWAGASVSAIWLATVGNSPPDGASVLFGRGASLYTDPCRNEGTPDIPVGPTVDDFVSAIADHPLLDATTPVDITLAGYSGKYLDVQIPSDPTIQDSSEPASLAGCPVYRPWEPGIFAQGPSQRWHLWIIDVDGVRVVVETMDYAGTSAQHRAELQAIVDSITIEP
jgi:hypothetical protein